MSYYYTGIGNPSEPRRDQFDTEEEYLQALEGYDNYWAEREAYERENFD